MPRVPAGAAVRRRRPEGGHRGAPGLRRGQPAGRGRHRAHKAAQAGKDILRGRAGGVCVGGVISIFLLLALFMLNLWCFFRCSVLLYTLY